MLSSGPPPFLCHKSSGNFQVSLLVRHSTCLVAMQRIHRQSQSLPPHSLASLQAVVLLDPDCDGHFSRQQTQSPWKEICSLPVTLSTLASVGGCLLAVGGKDDSDVSTSNVYQYDSLSDTWSVAYQMACKRSWCLAVTLPTHCVVIVGGLMRLATIQEV